MVRFVNRKDWEPTSSLYICIKQFEEKYYEKGKTSKRYRLAINVKLVPTIFDPKKVINKNSEINNIPHQSVFLREHRGNVYIKKINMNHLSPRTQLKTS